MHNKVILLCSGGIDSIVLLHWLIDRDYEVHPLHINYGQSTIKGEISAIHSVLSEKLLERTIFLEIPNIKTIGSGSLTGSYPEKLASREDWYKNEFFPNRNMIILSLAACYGEKINVDLVAIGVVGRNSYSDTTRRFIKSIEKTLSVSLGHKFEIIAPFAGMNRTVVVQEAVKFKLDLVDTFSCNALGDRHCMLCSSCLEREYVLKQINKLGLVNILKTHS